MHFFCCCSAARTFKIHSANIFIYKAARNLTLKRNIEEMSSEQRPITPTHIKPNTSAQASALTSAAHSMDDINMLLYLDALQRSTDNQHFLAQKVEEAYKSHQKQYYDYANLYSRYVALVKKANTRKLLQQSQLIELDFPKAEENAKCVIDKLNDDIVTAYMNLPDLENFKRDLRKGKKHANLQDLRAELMQLKKCTESIQSSMESIEAGLDNGISLGLDLSAQEVHMTNFPRLSRENETKN